jgi:hypothetical protein
MTTAESKTKNIGANPPATTPVLKRIGVSFAGVRRQLARYILRSRHAEHTEIDRFVG